MNIFRRFYLIKQKKSINQNGFTLMEIVIATNVFAVVVTMMLVLFNYTLKIQRRTEALRQASQGIRNFVEFMVKEIRNGQVDYGVRDGVVVIDSVSSNCPTAPGVVNGSPTGGDTYLPEETRLSLINVDGERECLYLDTTNASNPTLMIARENLPAEQVNSPGIKINYFKFYIRPLKDPYTDLPVAGSSLAEVQPFVSMVMRFTVTLATGETVSIPYQTSVSTNVYNIPNQ